MFEVSTPFLMALIGFLCGAAVGATARAARFCTLGAIEDTVLGQSSIRLKSWFLAIAVAMILVQFMRIADIGRLEESFYLSPDFAWLGAIIGGLLFGVGMALSGTCGFGILVRLGGGDLKAFVVFLVMGLSAYMTARGLTGLFRSRIIEYWNIDLTEIGGQGLAEILSAVFNIGADTLLITLTVTFVLAVLFWCISDRQFLKSKRDIISGTIVGLTVAIGFAATGILGNDPFEPQRVQSLTYVLPPGETIIYFLTLPGASLKFSIGLVIGTVTGAFAVAAMKKELRIEAFDDAREMRRNIFGAFLMGFGGVTAYGCTIGQGISAMAILSASAPIAMASIFLGATFGLYFLITGNWREAVTMIFRRFERSPIN